MTARDVSVVVEFTMKHIYRSVASLFLTGAIWAFLANNDPVGFACIVGAALFILGFWL